jgi:hypothetical protein
MNMIQLNIPMKPITTDKPGRTVPAILVPATTGSVGALGVVPPVGFVRAVVVQGQEVMVVVFRTRVLTTVPDVTVENMSPVAFDAARTCEKRAKKAARARNCLKNFIEKYVLSMGKSYAFSDEFERGLLTKKRTRGVLRLCDDTWRYATDAMIVNVGKVVRMVLTTVDGG